MLNAAIRNLPLQAVHPAGVSLREGWITALEGNQCVLDHHQSAVQALSCLIRPQVGDRVLYSVTEGGEAFILTILQREVADSAVVQVPGAQVMNIHGTEVNIAARRRIGMVSLGDCEVTAATGTLSLNARNLFTTVKETLIQQARYQIGRAADWALDVTGLLRAHAKQQIITADQDVKIDAERINMG